MFHHNEAKHFAIAELWLGFAWQLLWAFYAKVTLWSRE